MLSAAYQRVMKLLDMGDVIFPPSLQNALELRKLLLDPDSDNKTISVCIRKDAIISLAVLRLANAPIYVREIKEVQDAITFLGHSALNFVVFGVLQKQLVHIVTGMGGEIVKKLWQYSLDVSSSTFAIAKTKSTDLVVEESILLSLVLHLDLMFATYAVSKTDLNLGYQEYAIFIRRIAHANRNKLMSLYGVSPSVAQSLAQAYWSYPSEYLPEPLTAIEALGLGINSTEIPFVLRILVPAATYFNELTLEQLDHKNNFAQSLNF